MVHVLLYHIELVSILKGEGLENMPSLESQRFEKYKVDYLQTFMR